MLGLSITPEEAAKKMEDAAKSAPPSDPLLSQKKTRRLRTGGRKKPKKTAKDIPVSSVPMPAAHRAMTHSPWSSKRWAPAVFLAPAIGLLLLYLIYPLVESFRLSLLDWNGLGAEGRFVGLGNWRTLLGDPLFWHAARNNIVLAFFSVLIQLPIAGCWPSSSTGRDVDRGSSRSSISCRF